MPSNRPLSDHRILIVEDEYLIADDMRMVVEGAGGIVVGPFSNLVDDALTEECNNSDAAILDINIKGETSFGVADKLRWRGAPFCFATDYDQDVVPERFAEILRIEKPFDGPELIKELTRFCGQDAFAR